MPEMCQLCFLLVLPSPQSIFIMHPSCPKPLPQQHKPYMGKGWVSRVKIQTLHCITYSKPMHFPLYHANIGQTYKQLKHQVVLSTVKKKVSKTEIWQKEGCITF